MRIYNEIVIDMNPESSSYGETLHEDSFEYNGDMMLCQGGVPDMNNDGVINILDTVAYANQRREPGGAQGGYETAKEFETKAAIQESFYNPPEPISYDLGLVLGDVDFGGMWDVSDPNIPVETGGGGGGGGGGGESVGSIWVVEGDKANRYDNINGEWQVGTSYDLTNPGQKIIWDQVRGSVTIGDKPPSGKIEPGNTYEDIINPDPTTTTTTTTTNPLTYDPTSEEFRKSVEEGGGFGELAEGFGFKESDFEEFYGEPLGFMKEQKTLADETLDESLRSAREGYEIREEHAGMVAGQSLFDIKKQADVAAAKSGFATSGTVASTAKGAKRGVFGDYMTQQKELASGRAGARTAFDIGTKEADLTYRSDVSDFWKRTEDEFYDQLTWLEDKQDSDRRLKNNITKIGNSSSGINIYTFNYKNSDRYGDSLYQGVMSDEVPSSAVIVGRDGYDSVDYSKLDVEFKRVLI